MTARTGAILAALIGHLFGPGREVPSWPRPRRT